ncbi:MAG: hypothetical protein WAM00_03070, partial [Salegentibacter sp.]
MIRNYNTQRNPLLLLAPVLLLLLASCGSYQYSGYTNDGIYGDSEQPEPEYEQSQYANQNNREAEEDQDRSSSSYYKNLFAEESAMYEDMANSIFTDVESYSSNDRQEEQDYSENPLAYSEGYAPWGQDPDSYTINIYNNGFGYGYGYP